MLALNVAGMLLAFIALIAMMNALLLFTGNLAGVNEVLIQKFGQPLSMQLIFGLLLQYLAIGIGVPIPDAMSFGKLIRYEGNFNEFVAYLIFQQS